MERLPKVAAPWEGEGSHRALQPPPESTRRGCVHIPHRTRRLRCEAGSEPLSLAFDNRSRVSPLPYRHTRGRSDLERSKRNLAQNSPWSCCGAPCRQASGAHSVKLDRSKSPMNADEAPRKTDPERRRARLRRIARDRFAGAARQPARACGDARPRRGRDPPCRLHLQPRRGQPARAVVLQRRPGRQRPFQSVLRRIRRRRRRGAGGGRLRHPARQHRRIGASASRPCSPPWSNMRRPGSSSRRPKAATARPWPARSVTMCRCSCSTANSMAHGTTWSWTTAPARAWPPST